MAGYYFKSWNEEMIKTPERKALEVVLGGSAYDVSVYIMGIEKENDNSKNNFHKSIPPFDLVEFVGALKFTDNKDYYICPNTLIKGAQKRTEGTLFSLKNIVVDIDAHDYNGDFNEIKPIFIKTLREEFEEGGMPLWNVQVFTGRGYQLWWCLEETSKSLLWLYKHVQKGIMDKIQEVINAYKITFDEALTLDKSSSSKAAGLFRLFGTYNYITKTKTEVDILSVKYYELNDLKNYFCEPKEKKKSPVKTLIKNNKGKYVFNKSINAFRIGMIERLVKMRGKVIDKRELTCFVYYNECVQIYDRKEAKEKLNALNESYPIPLKTGEIRALVRGIDKAVNKKNQINCYNLTNARIIEMLDLNESEQVQLMFYPGMSGTADKNRARDTRRKTSKEERNKKVIELAERGADREYIAKQAGCSLRTVYTVIAKSDIKKKCEDLNECLK